MPEFRGNEALGLIRSGLRDFSVSRTSLTWGIPLPWDPTHVTYVWFDALTNYLTAVGFGSDDERFDAVVAGRRPPHRQGHHPPPLRVLAGDADVGRCRSARRAGRSAAGCCTTASKMSKSTGNVVKPLDLVDTVGVDGLRYYVLADTSYGNDGDFTYEGLVGRYNADLANNLGNLAARVATVVASKCGGVGPAPAVDSPLAAAAADAVAGAAAAWDAVAPSRALEATWQLVRATNAHLEANEPWKLDPGAQVDAVLGDALEALRIVAVLASPAIPGTAQTIWDRLGLTGPVLDQRVPDDVAWGGYPGGAAVTKGPALFPRITS